MQTHRTCEQIFDFINRNTVWWSTRHFNQNFLHLDNIFLSSFQPNDRIKYCNKCSQICPIQISESSKVKRVWFVEDCEIPGNEILGILVKGSRTSIHHSSRKQNKNVGDIRHWNLKLNNWTNVTITWHSLYRVYI